MPSRVNSVKAISATSFGSIHSAFRATSRGTASNGESLSRDLLEAGAQLLEVVLVEAGADLADIAELSVLEDAEKQRAEAGALVGRRPAADDELLALGAFDLEPGLGAVADDSGQLAFLETMPSSPASQIAREHLLALPVDVGAEVKRTRSSAASANSVSSRLLALDERKLGQVFAGLLEKIEGVELDRPVFGERVLKRGEIGASAFVVGDSLAVDQRGRQDPWSRKAFAIAGNFSVQSWPERV